MAFLHAAALSELPEGSVMGVEVGGKRVCLVNCEDEIYAFADNCSHRDFPLSNGELDAEDGTITCEWHGAAFDIRSGKALCLPAIRPIEVYDCRVEDGMILVDPR